MLLILLLGHFLQFKFNFHDSLYLLLCCGCVHVCMCFPWKMVSVIYREVADCGETLVSALKLQQPQDLWLTHTHTRTCGLNTHSQLLCQNPRRRKCQHGRDVMAKENEREKDGYMKSLKKSTKKKGGIGEKRGVGMVPTHGGKRTPCFFQQSHIQLCVVQCL